MHRRNERRPKHHLVIASRTRHALLTAHIIVSVALLGDLAGSLAVAVHASRDQRPFRGGPTGRRVEHVQRDVRDPLSFGALLSGVALGLGRMGRAPLSVGGGQLLLIASVMAVGGLVVGPAESRLLAGAQDATGRLIAAASYDVLALAVATGLSVFKPGARFRALRLSAAG